VSVSQLMLELPRAAMPTRREETGSRLNAVSFASVWASERFALFNVAVSVHNELA